MLKASFVALLAIATTCCAQQHHDSDVESPHKEFPGQSADVHVVKHDPKHVPSKDELQKDPHIADYALVSMATFPSLSRAQDALVDIAEGVHTFNDIARRLNDVNSVRGEARRHGELGLIEPGDIDPRIAKIAFDFRQPISDENNANLQGPVCLPSGGCAIFLVFQRYRKAFFSSAWREYMEHMEAHGMKLTERLQLIEESGDMLRDIAFQVWPQEHTSFKRLKVQQLKSDMKKIGNPDPSTASFPPPKNRDMTKHNLMMAARKKLFDTIDKSIIEDHPEIYAMSIEQIRQNGWLEPHHDQAHCKSGHCKHDSGTTEPPYRPPHPDVETGDFHERHVHKAPPFREQMAREASSYDDRDPNLQYDPMEPPNVDEL